MTVVTGAGSSYVRGAVRAIAEDSAAHVAGGTGGRVHLERIVLDPDLDAPAAAMVTEATMLVRPDLAARLAALERLGPGHAAAAARSTDQALWDQAAMLHENLHLVRPHHELPVIPNGMRDRGEEAFASIGSAELLPAFLHARHDMSITPERARGAVRSLIAEDYQAHMRSVSEVGRLAGLDDATLGPWLLDTAGRHSRSDMWLAMGRRLVGEQADLLTTAQHRRHFQYALNGKVGEPALAGLRRELAAAPDRTSAEAIASRYLEDVRYTSSELDPIAGLLR